MKQPEPQIEAETVETMPSGAIYVRVSSTGQMNRDGEDDGYSIPAQVKACEAEAASMGLSVTKAYVERAESARSDDRPVLKFMMEELPRLGVQFLIVHKVDRLARNRLDDALLYQRLVGMNITLVSASGEDRRHPSRPPDARHACELRRVLLEQPRHRSPKRPRPEAPHGWHTIQAPDRVPHRPIAKKAGGISARSNSTPSEHL